MASTRPVGINIIVAFALFGCSVPSPTTTRVPSPLPPMCPTDAMALLDAVVSVEVLVRQEPTLAEFEPAVDRAQERLLSLDLEALPDRCVDLVVAPAENATSIYAEVAADWRDCGGARPAACPFSDFWSSARDQLGEASDYVDLAARHASNP